MAKINFSSIGNALSGVMSTLSAAGVSSTSMPSVLSSLGNALGLSANPNEASELAICAQILGAAGNPALISALEMKLATEQGIPTDAAQLAMTLAIPGTNIPQVVLEIEQLIKQGG